MMVVQGRIVLLSFGNRRTRKIFVLIIGTLFIYYLIYDKYVLGSNENLFNRLIVKKTNNYSLKYKFDISPNVNIVDLTAPVKTKFECIQTRKLLGNLTIKICLHQTKKDIYVSGVYHNTGSVWEEEQVTRILQYLIRHPHLHFIDIGANIGTYTLFVAALGRFVLAIECFAPNIIRLQRAIQLSNVIDRVVVVQNAVFTYSGEYLKLSVDTKNIGGQGIYLSNNYSNKYDASNETTIKNPYIVKTITFNEVLPILVAHGIRSAVIKIDIEGSESFVVESGNEIFDTIDIPLVQMEWNLVRQHTDRAKVIINFFVKRNYHPITSLCQVINSQEYHSWPDELYWLKRNASNFC